MNKFCSLAVILTLAALPLAAQQGMAPSHAPSVPAPAGAAPAASELESAVARVNGVAITNRDVREQSVRLFPYYSIHGGKVPDKFQPEIRQKAIQQLITDELIYQEAKRRNMPVSPAAMQKVLSQAKARFGSAAAYRQFAIAQYGSVQNFEKRLRRAVVIAEFQNREFELKTQATEAQARAVYEKNKASFLRPESVWLQTISVILPEKPSEEQRRMARKRIEELLPQAKAAKNYEQFGVLAERVSEDDYRVMMGDRKWVHRVGLPKEIDAALAPLQAGQVSGIVEVPEGYTILRVNERRPQKQLTFPEVKDKLRQQLHEAARKNREETLEQQLRKKAHIELL
jgi:parvulin-like peptidyl-prolyl isomerase